MSFWNKNKLPAEYKDLSEDQITELLNKGKTSEAEALAAKTAAEGEKTAREKAEKEAKELREALAARPNPEPGDKGGDNGGRNQPTSAPPNEAEWLTDPIGSFNKQVAPTAAVALHAAIMSARLLAENFIQRQGPLEKRLWDKYGQEVQAIVDGLDPQQRIIPQTWINQFVYVKGLHLNDIVKEGQKNGDAFFSETAGPTGGGLPNPAPENSDTLTEQEKRIAKRFGVTEENYLKRKKAQTYGGPALVGGS